MHRHRCGLLAAWTTAWLAGRVPYDDVIDAVTAEQTHRVTGLSGSAAPVPLGWVLAAARERGETGLRAVLPVAGDPRGLPGPGPFTAAALQVGAGVVGRSLGLVPEPGGDDILWTAHELAGPPSPPTAVSGADHVSVSGADYVSVGEADYLSVGEADYDLTVALTDAARTLAALDVARWRPEAADLLGDRRADRRLRLPPGHDPRALGLLDRASRLADVLDLALTDAGGAVTSHEVSARDEALRPLARSVRRALTAAYNAA